MTYSILEKAKECKDTLSLIQMLKDLGIDVFDEVFTTFQTDKLKPYYIVLFILYAYSEDSPYVMLRRDTEKEAIIICDLLEIPEYIAKDLIAMQDKVIIRAIVAYVDMFEGAVWRALTKMKRQYDDTQNAITNQKITNENGDVDYKTVVTVTQSLERLAKSIDRLERELKTKNDQQFISNVKIELKPRLKTSKSGGIEGSKQIK